MKTFWKFGADVWLNGTFSWAIKDGQIITQSLSRLRSQVHMSKQLNVCQEKNTHAENGMDTKTADSRCTTEFNETNSSNCVSQLMSWSTRNLHTSSSAHDLAICTRSAQTSHKEEDFITTSQTVVSRYSAELSHRQDGPSRRFLQISYPQFRIIREQGST